MLRHEQVEGAGMAGRIFIETHEARFLGLPTGAMHLYLVHRDSDGAEYVLRAGPPGRLQPFGDMRIEVNRPIENSADARGDDSPEDRSSNELGFGARTTDQVWALMVKYARMIDAADYDYNPLEENSNAFVGALIHAGGGDPAAMLPMGVNRREAVGYESWTQIVTDIAPPSNGVVYGTRRSDAINGIQIDEVISARFGNDIVRAGRGNDVVYGGAGDDQLSGQAGRDELRGAGGDDLLDGGGGNDRLRGMTGRDVLVGGSGDDVLSGGSGADTFVFAANAVGRDRIDDFEDGIDRLRIEGSSFDELVVTRFGATGEHTLVALGGQEIELRNFDASRFDPSDLGTGTAFFV